MTPTQTRELSDWLDLYSSRSSLLDSRTLAAIIAAYAGIDDWEDPAQTVPAAMAAVGAAQVARQAQVGFIASFLELAIKIMAGTRRLPALPVGLGIAYPRPVEPFEVYSRPVFEARKALTQGVDFEEATAVALKRIEDVVLTDVALARREAARVVLSAAPAVTGYRRVIRPELSETGVCGLCVAAASQKYSTKYLLPIHNRCRCTVLPIVGDVDPATDFNAADLLAAYKEAAGTSGDELKKTRFTVTNTELGPTLAPDENASREAEQRKLNSAPSSKDPAMASGSGGSKQPPSGAASSAYPWGPEPDDPRSPEGRAYWDARRAALGMNFGDDADQVRPPEIKTVERLLARGDSLEPIPRVQRRSSNDYLWTPSGATEARRIEVKSLEDSTELHKATFPMRIKKAVGKSMKHGYEFRKTSFLVDAGDRLVLADVRRALRSYNIDNPDRQIDSLWLMSKGSLEQIDLA